jgi:hypothetical protein
MAAIVLGGHRRSPWPTAVGARLSCVLPAIVCGGGPAPGAAGSQGSVKHLEETITFFLNVGDDAVAMTESVAPGSATKNGLLPQIKTVADLPSADTRRWVPRRKAVIVDAVRQGVISLEEVCRRYQLSAAEFLSWQRAIATHGVPGLRVTRLQIYRNAPPGRPVRQTREAPYS